MTGNAVLVVISLCAYKFDRGPCLVFGSNFSNVIGTMAVGDFYPFDNVTGMDPRARPVQHQSWLKRICRRYVHLVSEI